MIFISVLIFVILFVFNTTITTTSKTEERKIIINGLIWILLDYYTIWRYESDDKPMKWVEIKRTKL